MSQNKNGRENCSRVFSPLLFPVLSLYHGTETHDKILIGHRDGQDLNQVERHDDAVAGYLDDIKGNSMRMALCKISKGGTTILAEVPEMFGAETILMNRCVNEELFCQTVVRWLRMGIFRRRRRSCLIMCWK